MKKDYTILAPQMSPIHFTLLEAAFGSQGYHMEVLGNDGREAIDEGLKYVNNDACYPSLMVVGQMMLAINSGKYDPDKVALLITQTGGGCRATNYIGFIRRALEKAGLPQIPVISISAQGLEKNPGLEYKPELIVKAFQSLIYGDVFQKVVYKTRPYEAVPGSVNALHKKWEDICIASLYKRGAGSVLNWSEFNRNIRGIIKDFDEIPLDETIRKPKVGIVGEILVKFMPAANNYLIDQLEAEGAEVIVPELLNFMLYCSYNSIFKHDYLGKSKKSMVANEFAIKIMEKARKASVEAFEKSKRFEPPARIETLAEYASPIASLGNQTGEGWFLTGEMIELIHAGAPNIVCAQPFACLPNHIVGKGVIKELRRRYPESNIVAVDYDPGASEVNQLNRIKLMLSTAMKKLNEQK